VCEHFNETREEQVATEAELTERINTTKAALAGLGDLRPGSRSEQYNTCANPRCACKAPPKHGPYHQLSYTPKARSRTPPAHPAPLRAQLPNYQKLPALLDELPEASIDLDRLRHGVDRRSATVTNHA